ncbi:caspase, EACC1-associated type [Lentzea flaviverrucosa]|uniref:AAA domain-containing protein n=1 Tax=Lentzea flaviverrucosa TaxID=200379 RepID=A0A1H9WL19_9PSEU|nr:AAA domain-containing protein [Lentzea flaviverrucosa]RDI22881.1 AAA domain-containing protein [Lentzea flaviverrucosa]SES34469.1 AAA domain-containing protein [Lentzea flaviverrucosa]
MTPLIKRALLIGTEQYLHLSPLACTRADTAALAHVLRHPEIGGFDAVEVLQDADSATVRVVVEDFLSASTEHEQVLLYVSGHGAVTSEFHFAATDTSPSSLEETAISASFVNDALQQCRAAQKIAMFDCCESGGFTTGFTTDVPKSVASAPILRSRGVYVLSSSSATETSYGGGIGPDGQPLPSVFTGEIVDALRSGRADRDGDGKVTIDELFDHVSERVRRLGRGQTPEKSALGVNDRIVLAATWRGPVPAFAPAVPARAAATPRIALAPPHKAGGIWTALLEYYQACLDAETAAPRLMSPADEGRVFVCVPGEEQLLSGALDADGSCPLPDGIGPLVGADDDAELWYGYPTAVLQNAESRGVELAPLLVRPVELVGEPGELRLRQCGPVRPYAPLAKRLLGEEDAQQLLETYAPTWHPGSHSLMVKDINYHLREEFELRLVQELDPEALDVSIDLTSPDSGVSNVALLFTVAHDTRTTGGLTKDLEMLDRKQTQISETALSALASGRAPAPLRPWTNVTPLAANEGQLDIIESAMTTSMTVATGPPGTGKSQLVANLVATAVCAGQSVLVVSTNNRAVDEVWERCEKIVPGSLVRTGSRNKKRDYRQAESDTLTALLKPRPGAATITTRRAELQLAQDHLGRIRAGLGQKATAEQHLLTAGVAREQTALAWQWRLPDTETLPAWALRARKLAKAWFFGHSRRTRFLRNAGWTGGVTPQTCVSAAERADAELRWRRARADPALEWSDEDLSSTLASAEKQVRDTSAALLAAVVAEGARSGGTAVSELLQASGGGTRDWSEVRAVLPHVRGWAVTALSARRFPMDPGLFDLVVIDEASQCLVPYVLPLLFRAKRALVIGDPLQLPPVVTVAPEVEAAARRAAKVRAAWLEERRMAFHRHSTFHACQRAMPMTFMLSEHFRCHPQIAEISNHRFYGSKLTVLTNVSQQKRMDDRAVVWVDVKGKAERLGSGSWVNPAEAAKTRSCVEHLLKMLPEDATVGVVTPFKGQEERISRWFTGNERVRVGTVHTFQGGERDAIVLSLVAADGMRQGSIAWLERQLFLWNVAITRARSHLIVVGDRSLWSERGGTAGALMSAATGPVPDLTGDDVDPLVLRLKQARPDAQLSVPTLGYVADAVVGTGPLLLDRGAGTSEPVRHLRLTLARTALLGPDAKRMHAWTLFDR